MFSSIIKVKFFLLLILVCAAFTVNAQNTGKQNTPTVLPIIPLIAEYDFAPVYLSQDIKDHPVYWRIIATFEPKDSSSVEIALIEKESNKRTYYCNSETNVKKRKMQGYEAVPAKIDFKPSESLEGLSIYGFGFLDKNKQPVLWRVIPTTEPSIRGKGINAVTDDSLFRIEYRDFGTTVGAGTAVKIGKKTYEVEPWAATSSPPYFYAYHGSFTIGRHMAALHSGRKKWSVISKPEKLKKDEKWVLSDENGYKRNLKIVSDKNNELVIDEVNPPGEIPSLLKIILHITPEGYNLRAFEMHSRTEDKKQMRLTFEPGLPVQTSSSAAFEGEFMISQGETKNVITGKIIRTQLDNKSISFKWLPGSPNWAKSKSFETLIHFETDGYSIETK